MIRVVALLVLLAGCGENVAPTVDSVRLSNQTARRFQEFFLTLVGVEDPDGNVYAGRVEVHAESLEGEGDLSEEVRAFDPSLDSSRGDIIVGVGLRGAIPIGDWKLTATFWDEAGAKADPRWAVVTLTF